MTKYQQLLHHTPCSIAAAQLDFFQQWCLSLGLSISACFFWGISKCVWAPFAARRIRSASQFIFWTLAFHLGLNFTALSNLQIVDLTTNHFFGPLPTSLSNCRKLKVLSLARNGLNGSIPESYANLTSLLFLSFSNNNIQNLSVAVSSLIYSFIVN